MNAKPWSLKWWTILLSTIAAVLAAAPAAALLMPADWRAPVASVVGVLAILVVAVLRSALFDADQDGTPDALQPKKPPRVPPLVVLVVGVAACLGAGCGGAQQVSAGAACGSMYGLIAARSDYTAERSAADLDSQHGICERLTADPVTP